jgi:hypothetical protein
MGQSSVERNDADNHLEIPEGQLNYNTNASYFTQLKTPSKRYLEFVQFERTTSPGKSTNLEGEWRLVCDISLQEITICHKYLKKNVKNHCLSKSEILSWEIIICNKHLWIWRRTLL